MCACVYNMGVIKREPNGLKVYADVRKCRNSDVPRIVRLHIVRNELRNVVKRSFRLSTARLHDVPVLVQRPEGVAEQVRWVILLFELNESVPVLAEAGFGFFWGLAATEELEGEISNCHLGCEKSKGHTLGKGPPCATGFNVLSNHCSRSKSNIEPERRSEWITHIFSRVHTLRVVNPEVPLVQSSDVKSGISLFLWQTRILGISDSPAREFKQPS